MTDNLMPCPFCGEEVKMGVNHEQFVWYQVECECGAIAGSGRTTREAAEKDWNRRSE